MEIPIQKQILDWLALNPRYGYFYRSGSAAGYGRRILGAGRITGIPDITGWLCDGRFLGIEVKDDKGKQSKEQQLFQQKAINYGASYLLARSLSDVESYLKSYYGRVCGSISR